MMSIEGAVSLGSLTPKRRVRAGEAAAAEGSPDAGSYLREAELASERLSAIVRLVIFAALFVLVMTTKVDHHHEHFALLSVLAYGGIALVCVVFAWARVYHPALAYVYVTFDVLLVCLSILLITNMLDLPPHMAFTVPASALTFVVLAHAAMRFRPLLVIHAGALTIVLMALGIALMPGPPAQVPFSGTITVVDLHESLLHSRVLPFIILFLATLALWATSHRTHEILDHSIDHSRRFATLSRFFSPQLADRLAHVSDAESAAGSHACAIMFIDIEGFTKLARSMDPEAVSRLLTDFRSIVTRVIFKHEGMVEKFIGDGVLVVFGALRPEADDARRAIACALAIVAEMDDWSAARSARGESKLKIGIGAHYGEVFVGAIGDRNMLEFTVLGDAVNIAERLERLTRVIDGVIVISRDILDAAGLSEIPGDWAPVNREFLKGRIEDIAALSRRASS